MRKKDYCVHKVGSHTLERSGSQTGATWLIKEEFLIPGRKFVPRRNWGEKAVDEKT